MQKLTYPSGLGAAMWLSGITAAVGSAQAKVGSRIQSALNAEDQPTSRASLRSAFVRWLLIIVGSRSRTGTPLMESNFGLKRALVWTPYLRLYRKYAPH